MHPSPDEGDIHTYIDTLHSRYEQYFLLWFAFLPTLHVGRCKLNEFQEREKKREGEEERGKFEEANNEFLCLVCTAASLTDTFEIRINLK